MIASLEPGITYIRVQKPSFDLVGLILSSLTLTGILAAITLGLGVGLGVYFIRRNRRASAASLLDRVSLHLDLPPPRS